MNKKQALDTLRRYNAWRRYWGPSPEGPDMPDSKEIGQAIDVAIETLDGIVNTPKKEPLDKEYYGG